MKQLFKISRGELLRGLTMSDQNVDFPSVGGNLGVPAEVAALSEAQKIKKGICPSCDGSLVFQEGCKVCYACGWGGCE